MAREFAVDENGSLVEVVRQHQNVELAQLEAEVTNLETQVEEAQAAAEAATARLSELQGQLADSKSDVDAARAVVGTVVETQTEGVDAGTDGSGSEVSDTPEEPGSDSTSVDGISVTF